MEFIVHINVFCNKTPHQVKMLVRHEKEEFATVKAKTTLVHFLAFFHLVGNQIRQ